MVYSVIQGSYELNKAFIIENLCLNKGKPELQCEGKCFLAEQLNDEKDKQNAQSIHKFNLDYGIFIPVSTVEPDFFPVAFLAAKHRGSHADSTISLVIEGMIKPPIS